MNIRQIKLALTVALLDQQKAHKPISLVRKAMGKFEKEVGDYVGLLEKGTTKLNDAIERRSFALRYKHCTLDLDIVQYPRSETRFVQHFDITPN